jgi:hypothetical protein
MLDNRRIGFDNTQREAPAPTRRRVRLRAVLLATIVVPVALITLIGLEPLPLTESFAFINTSAATLSRLLITLVSITAAFAVLLGVVNLLRVHLQNIRQRRRMVYSILTIAVFLLIVVVRIVERLNQQYGWFTIGDTRTPIITLTLLDSLQVAVESALAGMLFFFLVFAAFRMMRRGVTVWNALFVMTLLLVLAAYALPGIGLLGAVRDWLLAVPVTAGTRGLLIGIALGTLFVGIRVLIGQERTFRE